MNMALNAKLDTRYKIILALDPGVNNFAWSVIKNDRVYRCGFVQDPVKDLTGDSLMAELKIYRKEMLALIKKYKPQALIAERFMVRGRWLGATCEKINIMLGVLADICVAKKIDLYLITSALWKNSFNRAYGAATLNNLYKTAKKDLKMPAHIIDSTLIGYYMGNKTLKGLNLNRLIVRIQKRCLQNTTVLRRK
jgi:Holliday junction resolvasome RuvABC endonuclease subunit